MIQLPSFFSRRKQIQQGKFQIRHRHVHSFFLTPPCSHSYCSSCHILGSATMLLASLPHNYAIAGFIAATSMPSPAPHSCTFANPAMPEKGKKLLIYVHVIWANATGIPKSGPITFRELGPASGRGLRREG